MQRLRLASLVLFAPLTLAAGDGNAISTSQLCTPAGMPAQVPSPVTFVSALPFQDLGFRFYAWQTPDSMVVATQARASVPALSKRVEQMLDEANYEIRSKRHQPGHRHIHYSTPGLHANSYVHIHKSACPGISEAHFHLPPKPS